MSEAKQNETLRWLVDALKNNVQVINDYLILGDECSVQNAASLSYVVVNQAKRLNRIAESKKRKLGK